MKEQSSHQSEQARRKRFAELAAQSEAHYAFYFTNFLSPSAAAPAWSIADERLLTAWGGADGCERVMLRFGDPELFGYEERFPITCIQIEPLQEKFSDKLTHRDYLGALMNLGIERDTMGDLIVRNGKAWVFALDHIGEVICQELYQVKHTHVSCRILDALPEEAAFVLEEELIIVPSLRLDAVLAKLCHLSRGKAKGLFSQGHVLVNGRVCGKDSKVPQNGDVIVVRGFGKVIFLGEERQTGKGNLVVRIARYR